MLSFCRHLHRAILRLLRPGRGRAARRLIVVAARGITIQLSRPLKPVDAGGPAQGFRRYRHCRSGSLAPLGLANSRRRRPQAARPDRPLVLPLTDTLRGLPRRRYFVATSVPRICGFGYPAHTHSAAPPKSPNDLLDAARLHRRLAAIADVLDDLPGQAKRLARWRARRDRARARGAFDRLTPMRPGRPPGWRKPGTPRAHEVHRVLDELHGFAFWARRKKTTPRDRASGSLPLEGRVASRRLAGWGQVGSARTSFCRASTFSPADALTHYLGNRLGLPPSPMIAASTRAETSSSSPLEQPLPHEDARAGNPLRPRLDGQNVVDASRAMKIDLHAAHRPDDLLAVAARHQFGVMHARQAQKIRAPALQKFKIAGMVDDARKVRIRRRRRAPSGGGRPADRARNAGQQRGLGFTMIVHRAFLLARLPDR